MAQGVGVNLVTQQTVDKDELFICPFDPVHRISAKRFVYHIIKCRKNHPHLETATCPFNARHIILKPELRHHTSICPDRKSVEIELNSLDINELRNDHLAVSNEVLDFGDDEDWDLEIAKNSSPRVIDPFSSANKTFQGTAKTVKKVNTRREAIKQMKEKLRQDAYRRAKGDGICLPAFGEDDVSLRRPHFETGEKAKIFATSLASMSAKTNVAADGAQENGILPPSPSKRRPRLAANFSVPLKAPIAVGRGRHIREMQAAVGRGRAIHSLIQKPPSEPTASVKPAVNGFHSIGLNGDAVTEDGHGRFDAVNSTEWDLGVEEPNQRRKKIFGHQKMP